MAFFSPFDRIECEKMYGVCVDRRKIYEIVELMKQYRTVERLDFEESNIKDKIYLILCNSSDKDITDIEASDAFYIYDMKGYLFIDPNSTAKKRISFAHEFIHYIQNYMYGLPERHYDGWNELMARALQEKVAKILFNDKLPQKLLSSNPTIIKKYLNKIFEETDKTKEPEMKKTEIEEYFEENFEKHLNMNKNYKNFTEFMNEYVDKHEEEYIPEYNDNDEYN